MEIKDMHNKFIRRTRDEKTRTVKEKTCIQLIFGHSKGRHRRLYIDQHFCKTENDEYFMIDFYKQSLFEIYLGEHSMELAEVESLANSVLKNKKYKNGMKGDILEKYIITVLTLKFVKMKQLLKFNVSSSKNGNDEVKFTLDELKHFDTYGVPSEQLSADENILLIPNNSNYPDIDLIFWLGGQTPKIFLVWQISMNISTHSHSFYSPRTASTTTRNRSIDNSNKRAKTTKDNPSRASKWYKYFFPQENPKRSFTKPSKCSQFWWVGPMVDSDTQSKYGDNYWFLDIQDQTFVHQFPALKGFVLHGESTNRETERKSTRLKEKNVSTSSSSSSSNMS